MAIINKQHIRRNLLHLKNSCRTAVVILAVHAAIALAMVWPLATGAAPADRYLDFADDFVEIADTDTLDLGDGAYTVSAWINPTDWGQNSQGRIVDHGGGSSGNAGWSLHLENKGSRGYPQALRLQINNDSSISGQSNTGVISLNTWQHVAVTYDGDALTFYVDGVEAGRTTGVPSPARALPRYVSVRGRPTRHVSSAVASTRFASGTSP